MRHGLAVTEMAVQELPGNPNAVWAVKKNEDGEFGCLLACLCFVCQSVRSPPHLLFADPYHTYIVVSFVNATIVLSIGETVVEVNDSGIQGNYFLFRVRVSVCV
jgi:splicing factor 3B subunit 3